MKLWILVWICHAWPNGGNDICPGSHIGDNADCARRYEVFVSSKEAIERYKTLPNPSWARIFQGTEYDIKFEEKTEIKVKP